MSIILTRPKRTTVRLAVGQEVRRVATSARRLIVERRGTVPEIVALIDHIDAVIEHIQDWPDDSLRRWLTNLQCQLFETLELVC